MPPAPHWPRQSEGPIAHMANPSRTQLVSRDAFGRRGAMPRRGRAAAVRPAARFAVPAPAAAGGAIAAARENVFCPYLPGSNGGCPHEQISRKLLSRTGVTSVRDVNFLENGLIRKFHPAMMLRDTCDRCSTAERDCSSMQADGRAALPRPFGCRPPRFSPIYGRPSTTPARVGSEERRSGGGGGGGARCRTVRCEAGSTGRFREVRHGSWL